MNIWRGWKKRKSVTIETWKELGLSCSEKKDRDSRSSCLKVWRSKNALLEYWREIHTKNGYVEISTPIMLSRHCGRQVDTGIIIRRICTQLLLTSRNFAVKPMNCPGGILVYESEPRSYRDLPIRMGELGIVHRHEKSGQLHGLMRVRCFTQDDAHIFMTPEQVKDEIKGVCDSD